MLGAGSSMSLHLPGSSGLCRPQQPRVMPWGLVASPGQVTPGLVSRAVGHRKAMNSRDLTQQSCPPSGEALVKCLGAPARAGVRVTATLM